MADTPAGYQRTQKFFMGHTQDDFEKGSTKLGIDGELIDVHSGTARPSFY
jgi:hypothetical protein